MSRAVGTNRLRPFAVDRVYSAIRRKAIPPGVRTAVEIVADRMLLQAFVERLALDLVLDVGAHNGDYALTLRRLGYSGPICCFEPNPEAFAEMSRRFSRDPGWSGRNVALGACAGVRRLHVPRLNNLASFLESLDQAENTREVDVRIETLDDVLAGLLESTGARRVLLKTDTQGYDLEVIRGGERVFEHVVGLQCEISVVPIYEGMPHYLEVLGYLEDRGFELVNLCTAYRKPESLRIVEYDCLMARRGEVR